MCVFEQETPDYGRPVSVVLEAGLHSLDEGPVLDPDRPSFLRAEVSLCNVKRSVRKHIIYLIDNRLDSIVSLTFSTFKSSVIQNKVNTNSAANITGSLET